MNPWSRRTRNVEARLPSGQLASRKGRSPIRIGDLQNWILFERNRRKTEVKSKKKNKRKAQKKRKKKTLKSSTNAKSKTNGPSVGSSPGKWAPTFPKSSVWDLGWRAVPTRNPFLKIYVPIQVLMQGQKPKPNWNSFLHILHVRQIQEPECMRARQPRLQILHAPQMWIKRVSKSIFGICVIELTVYCCYFYLFCIPFFAFAFLCICDFPFLLHFLSAVAFCLHF